MKPLRFGNLAIIITCDSLTKLEISICNGFCHNRNPRYVALLNGSVVDNKEADVRSRNDSFCVIKRKHLVKTFSVTTWKADLLVKSL